MKYDIRGIHKAYTDGLAAVIPTTGDTITAFRSFVGIDYTDGALDKKTKELISVGIAAYHRCQYCIVAHVYNCLSLGATRQEIMEAALVAVIFGGGPSLAYSVTLVKDALDEFENDFK